MSGNFSGIDDLFRFAGDLFWINCECSLLSADFFWFCSDLFLLAGKWNKCEFSRCIGADFFRFAGDLPQFHTDFFCIETDFIGLVPTFSARRLLFSAGGNSFWLRFFCSAVFFYGWWISASVLTYRVHWRLFPDHRRSFKARR